MKTSDIIVERVDTPASNFIRDMYNSYPRNPVNNREFVMVYGEDEDASLACFELGTSLRGPDWVEIKFFHTYPQKQGIGAKALSQLQDHARKSNIKLDLWTWDKGRISPAKLKKFYGKAGFIPTAKRAGPTTMYWEPNNTKSMTEDEDSSSKDIFSKFEKSGYRLLGQGADATVWIKDSDPGVIKIIMPKDGDGAGSAAETFHKFYTFCTGDKYSHLDNLPKFITLDQFDVPGDLLDKEYLMVGMERLKDIPSGSFEEAMTWILSDIVTKNVDWNAAYELIKEEETWQNFDEGMDPEEILTTIDNWDQRDIAQWAVLYSLMRVLYQTGKINKSGWDLHTENAMMRNDGTLVIVDPWIS